MKPEKETTYKCGLCDREFKDQEALNMHNKAKHPASKKTEKEKPKLNYKKIRNRSIGILIVILIIIGIIWAFSSVKTLPPTDITGHVEENPASHVLKEPMPIAIQKHMLEHADGVGSPGVVINYNCEDYSCESGLIENLEAFAGIYDYVYVAPFKNMDAKIALTKLNKIDVLEEYDEERIEDFIIGF